MSLSFQPYLIFYLLTLLCSTKCKYLHLRANAYSNIKTVLLPNGSIIDVNVIDIFLVIPAVSIGKHVVFGSYLLKNICLKTHLHTNIR